MVVFNSKLSKYQTRLSYCSVGFTTCSVMAVYTIYIFIAESCSCLIVMIPSWWGLADDTEQTIINILL